MIITFVIIYQFEYSYGDENQCDLKKYSYDLENGCCFYDPDCEPQPCTNMTICVDVKVRKIIFKHLTFTFCL